MNSITIDELIEELQRLRESIGTGYYEVFYFDATKRKIETITLVAPYGEKAFIALEPPHR